jgi:DNA-binding winged helix-turn-helix (wHTH) protein/Flp pilus assembly protein TadD
MKPEGIFQFGKFQVDTLARSLRREDEIVALNRRAFDVLLYLVQNPGKVLTRKELLNNVWADTFVDENSLVQSISALRRALEEKPGDNNYIVTLPGRGYQFIIPVQVLAPANLTIVKDSATLAGHSPTALIVQQHTIRTRVITEEKASSAAAGVPESPVADIPKLWKMAVAVLSASLLIAGSLYYRSPQGKRLTEKDTVVLADFANTTGDAIFDDTLKTALNISLRQSPFLNVLPDGQVTNTLKLMMRPAEAKITPDLARELCQRAGSKAYIAGLIGSLGNEYVLGLKAINCQSGDTLAEEQVTAASKEQVLDALGKAASKLRVELGESLATLQKFDVPFYQATTSSLEALQAFNFGLKATNEKGSAAAIPHFQRAIELDPDFAMAYWAIGLDYFGLDELGQARECLTKAFQLREHVSEAEKMEIAAAYYLDVTGELEKAARTYEEEIEIYPRRSIAYLHLALAYGMQGEYEKAAESTRQGVRLMQDPSRIANDNLVNDIVGLQRFDEARQVIRDAQARNMDDYQLHEVLYVLGFFGPDSAVMTEQQLWFAARPQYENFGLALASDAEAYRGHLDKARELTKRALDSATRVEGKESGAIWQAIAAQWEAASGNPAEARHSAAEALRLAPANQGVESEAALAFAMAGDTARTESLALDLEKRFPLDTQMQLLWLPTIRAQLALDRKNPAAALNSLQAASPIELGNIQFVNNISCLYHVYVRGEAYLAGGEGNAAAAEFQKILDHSGIVWNCWTGALAHLGVARAKALRSRTSQGEDADAARVQALAAYKDFLTLWKDADTAIPILKQAETEYEKLRGAQEVVRR